MIYITDDGGGQMCNKIYNQMNVLASALAWDTEVNYFDFNMYESFAYNSSLLLKKLNIKKKNLFIRVYFKVLKLLAGHGRTLPLLPHIIGIEDQTIYEKVISHIEKKQIQKQKYYFYGWPFCNLPAVRTYRDELRAFYAPTNKMKEYIDICKGKYGTENTVYVGVHMRRGDYIKWRNGTYYFDDAVYKKYMYQIRDELKNRSCVFFLFSNEPINKSFFREEGFEVVTPSGNAEEDFHLLANMNYIMGPPSTFSGVASFLGNIPRYIIHNADSRLRICNMLVWLLETDNDGNPLA